MAWIRTATSLITFGFGVYKFFQLELGNAGREKHRIGAQDLALLMVVAGIVTMVLGSVDYWRNMRRIREQHPNLPRSLTAVLAAFILILGVLAMTAVILRQ